MKLTTIWAIGLALLLGVLAGCNEPKDDGMTRAPQDVPPAPEAERYPAETGEVAANDPSNPPPAPAPETKSPTAGDVYSPPVDAKPIPPENPPAGRRTGSGQAPSGSYAAPRAKGGQSYTVKKGDTLQKISQRFYGTTKQWNKIYQANKRAIKDPDKLTIGTKLTIPPK